MSIDHNKLGTDGDTAATVVTAATLRDWLKAHRIEEVECALADIAGVARGKAMPAAKFAELKPTFLPVSIFFQGITGEYVDFEGDQDYTEGDLLLVPDLTTIRTAPWAKTPTAHVVKAIDTKAGTLTIQHGPIAAVSWPAMTMTFKAKPATLLKGLKVGQTIAFDCNVQGMKAEITAIRPN